MSGIAYVGGASVGELRTYTVDRRVVWIAYDPDSRVLRLNIRLVGTLQTVNGPDSMSTVVVPANRTFGAGQTLGSGLRSTDHDEVSASFVGWFFGPQAREMGISVPIFAAEGSARFRRIAYSV